MELDLRPGTYVVAVSGGVDSMALLHMLKGRPELRLVVAHLDHGIREDSVEDRRLVESVAKAYELPYIYDKANLGPNASEDTARRARYDFLEATRKAVGADAIITAHHQDDLLETIIMKLLRGTGRNGFSALRSQSHLIRPLLHMPKHALKRYALDNQIKWREDSTNADTNYLRNYVRHTVLPRLTTQQKQQLIDLTHKTHNNNQEIQSLLTAQLHLQPALNQLFRHWFISLPSNVSAEVMAQWLRNNGLIGIDRKLVQRAVVGAKTLPAGKQIDLLNGYKLEVKAKTLALVRQ